VKEDFWSNPPTKENCSSNTLESEKSERKKRDYEDERKKTM